MREEFLHFVWQHRLFEHRQLTVDSGGALEIVKPGMLNRDAGPDFSEAQLRLDGLEWAGHVEMHLRSSDWERHGHTGDAAYDNVILHVVWTNDVQVIDPHGKPIPTLSLKDRVAEGTISNYEGLMTSLAPIPCAASFPDVDGLTKISMLSRSLLERLGRKSAAVAEILLKTGNSWEETTYVLLARGLGAKVNAEPFQKLAMRTPLKLLRKHAGQSQMIEAMLFGQAGLLSSSSQEPYIQALKRDYLFLQRKYGLQSMEEVEWKFHRLRPANFPTLRIAQLAAVINSSPNLFNLITETPEVDILVKLLRVKPSTFWLKHFHFNKEVEKTPGGMGRTAAELIIINVIAPLLHAYSTSRDTDQYTERALALLENLPTENNRITRQWEKLGLKCESAADSQAALELFQQYCQHKRCLECKVGYKLLRK